MKSKIKYFNIGLFSILIMSAFIFKNYIHEMYKFKKLKNISSKSELKESQMGNKELEETFKNVSKNKRKNKPKNEDLVLSEKKVDSSMGSSIQLNTHYLYKNLTEYFKEESVTANKITSLDALGDESSQEDLRFLREELHIPEDQIEVAFLNLKQTKAQRLSLESLADNNVGNDPDNNEALNIVQYNYHVNMTKVANLIGENRMQYWNDYLENSIQSMEPDEVN